MLDQLAFIGTKLHLYDALEPHREKIRQFTERFSAEARQPRNPPGNQARPQAPFPPATRGGTTQRNQASLKICQALLDPEQFASTALENILSIDPSSSSEARATVNADSEILLQLFPSTFNKLTSLPVSTGVVAQALANWGEKAPLEALEAFRKNVISKNQLRNVAARALTSRHKDAEETFWKSIQLSLQPNSSTDSFTSAQTLLSFSASFSVPTYRSPDIEWYSVARHAAPELGRAAAWQLAFDYLNGRYEERNISILPMAERPFDRMLAVAYCVAEDYPDVAQQILDRALPRVLANVQQASESPFSRNADISLAAWFDPQATTDLIIKLKKQFDEEQKNQPANQRSIPASMRQAELLSLRNSCLRGLLLDEQ